MARPRIYNDPNELNTQCEMYFESIEGELQLDEEGNPTGEYITNPRPPTVNGLALFLGFSEKKSLYDYAKRDGFLHPIKKALTKIELSHEEGLYKKACTGHIFALKNSGWTDAKSIEHSTKDDKGIKVEYINAAEIERKIREDERGNNDSMGKQED